MRFGTHFSLGSIRLFPLAQANFGKHNKFPSPAHHTMNTLLEKLNRIFIYR